MPNKNGESSPEWQRLRDIESKKTYQQYYSQVDPDQGNPRSEPDRKFSEEDGYTSRMQRGPKELMAFKILEKAVRSLSKKQRDTYNLVYKSGFNSATAGLMLGGISRQAVDKNLKAALRNIAKYCSAHAQELENA
jgi:DNA-directed RNA polymerase specialized sigma24 family protein